MSSSNWLSLKTSEDFSARQCQQHEAKCRNAILLRPKRAEITSVDKFHPKSGKLKPQMGQFQPMSGTNHPRGYHSMNIKSCGGTLHGNELAHELRYELV